VVEAARCAKLLRERGPIAAARRWSQCCGRYWRPRGRPPRRLVHRDVKPENVLISEMARSSCRLRAWCRHRRGRITSTASSSGSCAYLSPEQVRPRADERGSDVYAVGISDYELLTGVTPFTGDNPRGGLSRMDQMCRRRVRPSAGCRRSSHEFVARPRRVNPGAFADASEMGTESTRSPTNWRCPNSCPASDVLCNSTPGHALPQPE